MTTIYYTSADGTPATEGEALRDGKLRQGFYRNVRRPLLWRDGAPEPLADTATLALFDVAERAEVQRVFDALGSSDADRLDWGRLEANRIAARLRASGNPRGAAALE